MRKNISFKLCPAKISQFENHQAKTFYLITPRELMGHIEIIPSNKYPNFHHLVCDDGSELIQLFQKTIENQAHILLIMDPITTLHFSFVEFANEHLKEEQKLLSMPVYHGHDNVYDVLGDFIKVLEDTNFSAQQHAAAEFVSKLNSSSSIVFSDDAHGASARLLLNENEMWSDLSGLIEDSNIMLAPPGELALSHKNHDAENLKNARLSLNGTLILSGYVLLQNMSPGLSFTELNQKRLFKSLSTIINEPIVATLDNGMIVDVTSADKKCPALLTLKALMEVDERLRIITEIGFGFNKDMNILQQMNTALNEIYGRNQLNDFCVHFGIGTRNTLFHTDFICPQTNVHFC